MDCDRSSCSDCPARIVCRCLQVTEAAVLDAIATQDLRTVKDVRRHTGAGEGCTCCHEQLRRFLERQRCATANCG